MRRALIPAAIGAALLAATAKLGTDYPFDAGPAITDLARGNIHGFVTSQPQMGPLSLLLRAPLAALAGPNSVWAYRLGALVCLLASLGLGALFVRRAGARAAVLGATLVIVNPVSIDAIRLGHPEERLGGALCVIALLLARDRQIVAGIALGAALATKQWALIAIAPVLVAAPHEARMRLFATAIGVAAIITGPFALADPHAFVSAMDHPAFGVAEMRTGNVWGWAAINAHAAVGGGQFIPIYITPDWLQRLAHPLVAALTLGLGAAALRSRRAIDPLALLAFLMLARCALDPWDHAYYHAPFISALIAWELLHARRAPWLAAISAGFLGVVFRLDLPMSDLLYVLWALPLGFWLSRRALRLEPLRLWPAPVPAG